MIGPHTDRKLIISLAILDNVRVTIPLSDSSNVAGPKRSTGSTYGIKEFATVGVRDGALIVTCFDPEVSNTISLGTRLTRNTVCQAC